MKEFVPQVLRKILTDDNQLFPHRFIVVSDGDGFSGFYMVDGNRAGSFEFRSSDCDNLFYYNFPIDVLNQINVFSTAASPSTKSMAICLYLDNIPVNLIYKGKLMDKLFTDSISLEMEYNIFDN